MSKALYLCVREVGGVGLRVKEAFLLCPKREEVVDNQKSFAL